MRAIKFKQANANYPTVIKRFGKKQISIPAFKYDGIATTVWKGNFSERVKFLFTGKMYLSQACPNQPMQAVAMNITNPIEKKKTTK